MSQVGKPEVRSHSNPPRSLNIMQLFIGADTLDAPYAELLKDTPRTCCSTPSPSAKALRSEALRLATYVGWPVTFLPPQLLASVGFFYRGHGDEVQCAFCLIRINSWEPSDDPMSEHRRHMPSCPFVNNLPVGNVPLSPNSFNSSLTFLSSSRSPIPSPASDAGSDICARHVNEVGTNARPEQGIQQAVSVRSEGTSGSTNLQQLVGSLSSLSIQTHHKAEHPEYATLVARLKSYSNWPIALTQRPAQLAEAGFYYLGVGDQVTCFSCDKGLRNWEPNDQPWEEHARWSPECSFVLSVKGAEFVRHIHMKPNERPLDIDSQPIPITEDVCERTTAKREKQGEVKDSMLCKICYEEPFCMVFLPCGHSLACPSCSSRLSTCPVCRKPIEATVRAFFS